MTKQDQLLEHDSDGIKEYDNDLPRWWVWLFWITIIVAPIYAYWFHGVLAPTDERLAHAMSEVEAKRATQSATANAVEVSEDNLLALVSDTQALAKGSELFASRCAACHQAQGQGLIGPNLTDKHWIHGGKIVDIRRTISEGVPEKGMLSWKTMLSADEMNAVTAYVWTLRGTNPPNPKAAEGQLVE